MSEIMPFNYGDRAVRTVMIDGEPWFVAVDVCAILDIRDASDAVRRLDEDDRGLARVTDQLGRPQQTNIINESGLYELVIRSDKSEAKVFRRWITREVLPSIRRQGYYAVPEAQGRIESAARVLQTLRGIVEPGWLEAKARILAGRALGEMAEVNPINHPLTVSEFLDEKGFTVTQQRKHSGLFGKRLKRVYRQANGGADPVMTERFVDGAPRQVACYTEEHRPLFEQVWREFFAEDD